MPGLRPPLLFNQLKAFSRPSFFPAPGNDVVSQVALHCPFQYGSKTHKIIKNETLISKTGFRDGKPYKIRRVG